MSATTHNRARKRAITRIKQHGREVTFLSQTNVGEAWQVVSVPSSTTIKLLQTGDKQTRNTAGDIVHERRFLMFSDGFVPSMEMRIQDNDGLTFAIDEREALTPGEVEILYKVLAVR